MLCRFHSTFTILCALLAVSLLHGLQEKVLPDAAEDGENPEAFVEGAKNSLIDAVASGPSGDGESAEAPAGGADASAGNTGAPDPTEGGKNTEASAGDGKASTAEAEVSGGATEAPHEQETMSPDQNTGAHPQAAATGASATVQTKGSYKSTLPIVLEIIILRIILYLL